MYSSEDLERFYFQYQTEAMPRGESVEQFCLKNKVPYNIFSKWYKDTRKKIVEVNVTGRPSETDEGPAKPRPAETATRIWLELRMSNGLHISKKNLSYQELVNLVGKLEGLC